MLKGVSIKPNRTSAHTSKPLTNLMVAHYQSDQAFIADKVFPTVPVSRSTDLYYEIPRGAMNRHQVQERARGAKPTLGGFDYNKKTYSCDIYALKVGLTDEDDTDFDEMIQWDTEATSFLALQVKLNREITWNEKFFKTGVWGTDVTGVNTGVPTANQFLQWNDDASDPIADIKRQKVEMLRKTGFMPNVLTLPYEVYNVLTEHPDIIDRIKYGQTPNGPAIISKAALAQLFDVDEILVGYAIKNDANERIDDREGNNDNHDFIMEKGALLTYRPTVVGKRTPSAGYNFCWKVYSDLGFRMRTYRGDEELTDFRIMDDAYDQNLVSADLGVYYDQVIG